MRHSNRCRGADVLAAALALAVSCCAATRGSARGRLRVHTESPTVVIRKPLTDDRVYEYAVLDNGLKVLAVEDAKAAKAGFGIAVKAGAFYDPPSLPGLAHFCEHLLFLGTRKYPNESSFDIFMSEHDGVNNAYTEEERTVFYNEVGHAGFDEGLDRFAQFFIEPLFKGDMVGRELNAVNSEHQNNVPDQSRRLWQILRGTAGNASVLGRFYTGTTETLHHGDATTVAALRKYHKANYCAPRMSLVMISNLPAAQQLEAGRKHFAGIPRGSCGAPKDFREQGRAVFEVGKGHLGQFIHMGTKSTPSLWMMFPLEPTLEFYKEAPAQYLEYVLDYAGPHSLKSLLKMQGLITGLNVEMDQTSAATLTFIQFELTPEGAKEDSVRAIAGSTLALLRLLKEETEDEVLRVYKSLQQMSAVDFDYYEAPDSVMDFAGELAAALSSFAPQDVLTGSNGVVNEVNSTRVRALLEVLANPHGMNMALATPDFKPSPSDLWEPYYGIAFRQAPIAGEWISSWASGGLGGLRTAPALHYVPTALAVGQATAGKYPKELHVRTGAANTALELWWKGQGHFALPKVQLFLRLGMRASRPSAELTALRLLHAELATQALEEPLEDFRYCGLDHEVKTGTSSYVVKVSGYDQHSGDLLLQVLEGLLELNFDAQEFARAHRQVFDRLVDAARRAPYELAEEELGALTVDAAFSREEILEALKLVGEQRLHRYLAALHADGLRAQLLVVGNMDEAAALQVASGAADHVAKLEGGLLPAESTLAPRVLMATEPLELRMKNPIPGDSNHVTLTSYQYGVADLPERVRLLLLGKMIADPVYDALRTKEQLGYVVFGFIAEQVNVLDLRVLVQGGKELPETVDAKIEEVVDDFGAKLKAMSQKEFLTWKNALRSELHRQPQNMGQEADRYWAQIVNDAHCFNRRELALEYLETLESADAVFDTFRSLRAAHRKVSVKMFGGGADPAEKHSQHLKTSPRAQFLVSGGISTAAKAQLAGSCGVYPVLEHCTARAASTDQA